MCDPCNECVVRPCCEQICKDRIDYSSLVAKRLKFIKGILDEKAIVAKDLVDEYWDLKELYDQVLKRNFQLTKHFSSSTSQSSGSSFSIPAYNSTQFHGHHIAYSNSSYSWEKKIISSAANSLAKAIDDEILKSFVKR